MYTNFYTKGVYSDEMAEQCVCWQFLGSRIRQIFILALKMLQTETYIFAHLIKFF
jgi:hypothetical protein